jgi:hypothetical protein
MAYSKYFYHDFAGERSAGGGAENRKRGVYKKSIYDDEVKYSISLSGGACPAWLLQHRVSTRPSI